MSSGLSAIVVSRETGSQVRLVCPRCRGELKPHAANDRTHRFRSVCADCSAEFDETVGFADLRVASDRYLSLNQERRKALRLSRWASSESLEGLARRYYRMTADVSVDRENRFVRHILDAQARGLALLARLPVLGNILDIGCGTGGFVAAAASAGRDVVGVDIASRWLVLARKRLSIAANSPAKEAGSLGKASLLAACANNLPFPDDSFSIIVADSLLEHLEEPEVALAELLRVLKPGGELRIWSPNRLWPGPDPHVGLIGLPLMPESWVPRYVRLRRGPIYFPRCRAPFDWSNLVRGLSNELSVQCSAADLSAWPVEDRSPRGRAARFLGRMSQLPIATNLLTRFGPIGEVVVRKIPEIGVPLSSKATSTESFE